MLTVKLTTYNRKEVDELHEIVHNVIDPLCDKSELKFACNECTYRHLCADLRSLSRYLREEQNLKYPHVRNGQR